MIQIFQDDRNQGKDQPGDDQSEFSPKPAHHNTLPLLAQGESVRVIHLAGRGRATAGGVIRDSLLFPESVLELRKQGKRIVAKDLPADPQRVLFEQIAAMDLSASTSARQRRVISVAP